MIKRGILNKKNILIIIFTCLISLFLYNLIKNEHASNGEISTVSESEVMSIVDDNYNIKETLLKISSVSTEEILNTANKDYSKYIITEGNIDNSLVSYLKQELKRIPSKLLDKYFEEGGTILLTSKDISKTYYPEYNFGNVIGIHDSIKNVIYISNSEYAIDNSLIHEFGHVLDSFYDYDSRNSDFSDIYTIEKDTFEVFSTDDHYKINSREFFAEVFQQCILSPKNCKESAPKSYMFVLSKLYSL